MQIVGRRGNYDMRTAVMTDSNSGITQEQAKEYGHSLKRELAFLIAHSMLHLCGYDHMTQEEAHIMEKKQEEALNALGITRRDGQDE